MVIYYSLVSGSEERKLNGRRYQREAWLGDKATTTGNGRLFHQRICNPLVRGYTLVVVVYLVKLRCPSDLKQHAPVESLTVRIERVGSGDPKAKKTRDKMKASVLCIRE